MPRISRDDQLERDLIAKLRDMIDDSATPLYVTHRCMATLATMLRRRSKRQSEKQAEAKLRKQARDEAERASRPYVSHLPSNGREPPGWRD